MKQDAKGSQDAPPGEAVSSRLRKEGQEVRRRWQERMGSALAVLGKQGQPLLDESIPALLETLAEQMVAPADAAGNRPFPGELPGLHPGSCLQLIVEYRFLREVLLDVLETPEPLDQDARGRILAFIDDAISETTKNWIRLEQKARYWTEEQYRLVVEHAPDYAILLLDPQGFIVSWNPSAERIIGHRPEEILGEPSSRLFVPEDVDAGVPDWELRTAVLEGTASDDRWLLRKDGSRFWANGVTTPILDESGTLCGFSKMLRDDTEARMAEARRQIMQVAAEALTPVERINTAWPRILHAICEWMNWAYCALWLVDPASGQMHYTAAWWTRSDRISRFDGVTREKVFERGVGLPGIAWAEEQPVWLADLDTEPDLPRRAQMKQAALRSAVAFPVVANDGVYGVFEFFSRYVQPPDPHFIAMMEQLGRQIGELVQRQTLENTASRAEALETAILSTALDAIIVMDHRGKVVEFNPAAERIFGYSREAAIGASLADLIIPPRLRSEHWQGLSRYLVTGGGAIIGNRTELPAVRADGSEFPVELAVTRIPGEDPPLFAGYLRDITDRKQMEAELRQRAEDLAEADRRKDQFLAVLAHELRNPLGAISNALEVSGAGGASPDAAERARKTARRQVGHMARMLEDLLDVSRITHGKMRLREELLDLNEVLRQAVEDFRPHLEAGGLRVEYGPAPEPLCICGDSIRLAQVFGNLLDNSRKFTGAGGEVQVRVERRPGSDGGPERGAAIIRDTGAGIPAEMLPRLFQTFAQAEQTVERAAGGLGLGLALVKGLVQLHGGEVLAASEGPGRGAEFTVLLPLVEGDATPRAPAAAPAEPRNLRVLIVEDNQDAAALLKDLLELFGHQVETAYDGFLALDAARRFAPEVILCDIGLPGLDGYTVASRLREERIIPESTRLIAVSGWGQEEDRHRSRRAGFDMHLTKPVNPAELKRLLETQFGG